MKIPQTLRIILSFVLLAGTVETWAGEDGQVVPIFMAPPAYPAGLLNRKIDGSVVVEFIVGTDGLVKAAQVIRSTDKGFEPAALQAIRRWRFRPGLKDGVPVNVRVQQELYFDAPALEAVYPFAQLCEGREGTASLGVWVDENKMMKRVVVLKASDPVFGKTALAIEEAEHTTKPYLAETANGRMIGGSPFVFKRDGSGNIKINASTREILKSLKKSHPSFFAEADLDKPLVPVSRMPPVFPLALRETHTAGTVIVEFFIDRLGHAQLPRVVSASHEDFGYAAAQAVAQWQFEPPLKNGTPVIVRVQVPLEFKFQPEEISITPP